MLASEAPASAAAEAAPEASAAASSAPGTRAEAISDRESPGVDTAGGGEEQTSNDPASAASEAPASAGTELYMRADPSAVPSGQTGVVLDPAQSPDTIQAIDGPTAPAESDTSWLPAAVLVLGLGVALVVLRWGARRLT